MAHWSLRYLLFSFQLFACILLLFLLLSSNFNALWSERMHGIISVFLYLLRHACALRYDQFWRRFHGLLRRIYIIQKLDEIFCICLLGPFDLWYGLDLGFLYWFFVWITCLLVMGVLKSPTITVLESIYVFRSFRVCLMKLGALMLGGYRMIIVISFWCIFLFISVEYPSLSHLINVSLASTFSEISIATSACFGGPFTC
jgi:hypothetical protein